MTKAYTLPTIDQYLRERLMPVKGTIPNIVGIDMYGKSIPAGTVGGDLFEYINFQQRYDITARIQGLCGSQMSFSNLFHQVHHFVTQSTTTCNG
jgi:hypothetical protein